MSSSSGAWSALATVLSAAGCRLAVGVPSDEPGLLDASIATRSMATVAVRDQRVAGGVAAGYTSASGAPSVVALETGPSFANAVAALSEIASLRRPVVVVTTSVPAREAKRGAFQELDQHALAAAFACWFQRVEHRDDLGWAARYAVHMAVNGGPGVAVLEVTPAALEGAQTEDAGEPAASGASSPIERLRSLPPDDQLEAAANLVDVATAPVVVAGGGSRGAGVGAALHRLAEMCGAPVLTTAAGRGVVDETDDHAIGLAGLYAAPPIAELLETADLVLAFGTQIEETVRMGWPSLGTTTLVHVDMDPRAFGRPLVPAVALLGDAGSTASALVARLDGAAARSAKRRDWQSQVAEARQACFDLMAEVAATSPAAGAVAAVSAVFGTEASFAFENGLHDMWAYHWPLLQIRRHVAVTPGEQTMMGFGLPAAIGAGLADQRRPAVVFTGDGAFAMHPSALASAVQHGVPVTAVVFDNQGLGWPRRARRDEPNEIRALTSFEPPLPPAAIAAAVGVWSTTVDAAAELHPAVEHALELNLDGEPAVVVIPVDDDDVPLGVRRVFG